MRQKKEDSNFIKEHLKKRGFMQTWLAQEFGMNFSITNVYIFNHKLSYLAIIFKVVDLFCIFKKP